MDGDLLDDLDDDPAFSGAGRTHDVIISEMEEINLEEYMSTLEPPTFSEEMADELFGFRSAFVDANVDDRGVAPDAQDAPNAARSVGLDEGSIDGPPDRSALPGAPSAEDASSGPGGSLGADSFLPFGAPNAILSAPRTKPETPGRAGRRGWSRQGASGANTASNGGEVSAAAHAERPPTGGLDEADCSPLDGDDADPEFAHINADIYDDSDDESFGPSSVGVAAEATAAQDGREPGDIGGFVAGRIVAAEGASSAGEPAAAPREGTDGESASNVDDARLRERGQRDPSSTGIDSLSRSAADDRDRAARILPPGASRPDDDDDDSGTTLEGTLFFSAPPSPPRRRRAPDEDDFVVMSTPSGLRRVPSARRRRRAESAGGGARAASSGGSPSHRQTGPAPDHLRGWGFDAFEGLGAGSDPSRAGSDPATLEGLVSGSAKGSSYPPTPASVRASVVADLERSRVGPGSVSSSSSSEKESKESAERRERPARVASAGAARAQMEVARRLEMLQRPPSRQRPPPEAIDLFAKGRAAAAAAAAAPAVPGLNKVRRPAGMASHMSLRA